MHYRHSGPLHRPCRWGVGEECCASECNCKPLSRSCFFSFLLSLPVFKSNTSHTKKREKKPRKNRCIKKKDNVSEMLDGRMLRCDSEVWVHLRHRCLLPLLGTPPDSQTRWVCRARCSPPLGNIIGHIQGLAAAGKQRRSPLSAYQLGDDLGGGNG